MSEKEMKKWILGLVIILVFFVSKQIFSASNMTFVGDSIMNGGKKYIAPNFKGAYFDTKIGRQFSTLPEIVKKLKESDELGDVLVVGLGTNGPFSDKDFDDVVKMMHGKDVFFINTAHKKWWEQSVNEKLRKKVNEYANVHLIDVYSKLKTQKQYYVADGVHLTDSGYKYYAGLVSEALKKYENRNIFEKGYDAVANIISEYYNEIKSLFDKK